MDSTSRHRVPSSSPSPQADLFTAPNGLLEGFCYRPNVLSPDEEGALVRELANLSFRPFDFHGYLATRQVVSFGYRYDYDGRAVVEASPFPSFLVSLPIKIAAIFDRPPETFRQVLINEYRPGAGSGWHRDKAQFDEVAACRCLPRASCVFDGRPVRLGTERRSRSSHARLIFFRRPPHRVGAQHSRA